MTEFNDSISSPQRADTPLSENKISVSDTSMSITLKQSGKKLDYPETAGSLLEALEYHGIAVEYQCRSGYCGSCRCRMTKGTVIYRQEPLALVNDGEILPCCSRPASDIELDI